MALLPTNWTDKLRLYVITDRRAAGGRDLRDIVAAALEGGATAIQLRDKEMEAGPLLALGHDLRRLCADAGALFIVNDRIDLAYALEADGIHLGQDDLPAPVARHILGPDVIIGGSAGNAAEGAACLAAGVDYLGVGPIYHSGSKADAGRAIGPEAVTERKRQTGLPIVGIGGINAENAAPVIAAGAEGVAVIAAIVGSSDVREAAARLRAIVDATRR